MDNNLILLLVVLVVMAVIILAIAPWRTEEDTKKVTSEKTTKTMVKVEKIKPKTKVETLVITESANSGEILTVSSASLESMTVSQLRELAKARNISGYSSMNKTELISKLS